jgi:hypothetical protein
MNVSLVSAIFESITTDTTRQRAKKLIARGRCKEHLQCTKMMR